MGGKKSKPVLNSFFLEADLEILKNKFVEFNQGKSLFALEEFPDFPVKIQKYISGFVKSKEDFKGFVGAIECLIYGKSTIIIVPLTSSFNLLIEILDEPLDSIHEILPKLLFSLCGNKSSILSYISPPQSDIGKIKSYLSTRFPILFSSFSRYVKSQLFDTPQIKLPIVPIPDRNIHKVLELLYFSSTTLAANGAELHRIYLSDIDGLSFNRIAAAISGYQGPMIMVIKLQGDIIIGAYIGDNLKDNAMISGSMDTFLFTLSGGFRTFKSEFGQGGGKFIYFNSKLAKSVKYPKGLGFGGDITEARVWIDDDIEECFVSDSGLTYEFGNIVEGDGGKKKIVVFNIEVWGCGGDSALEYQEKFKKGEDARISNARKVDKAQLANNEFNRENLLGGTFKNSEYKPCE